MADLEAEKSDDDNDEEEFIADVQPSTSRKMPKRSCRVSNYASMENSTQAKDFELDDSFDNHIDNLVEAAVNNVNEEPAQMIVSHVLESLFNAVVAEKSGKRRKKGQPDIGRKSKKAKNFMNHWKNLDNAVKVEKLKANAKWKEIQRENESSVAYARRLQIQRFYRKSESKSRRQERLTKDAEWHKENRYSRKTKQKHHLNWRRNIMYYSFDYWTNVIRFQEGKSRKAEAFY